MNKHLITMFAVLCLLLTAAPEALAWGAARRGVTYHGSGGGFYHTSSRASYGPYGAHASTRTTAYSPTTGFYHSGSGRTAGYGGTAYHSSSAYRGSTGYGSYGGYHATYGGTRSYAGAYRRW